MKSIKSIWASIYLALPLAVFGSQFTNGSFERPGEGFLGLPPGDTRLVGWTIGGPFGGVECWRAGSRFSPVDGEYDVTLRVKGSYISQTFDTLAERDYSVTFFVAGHYNGVPNPGDARLEATVTSDTGVRLATLIVALPPTLDGYGTQQRFMFTATSAQTTVKFLDLSTSANFEPTPLISLDAVDVSILAPTNLSTPPSQGLVAYFALGQNLLVNGDFEAGNSGFTSKYAFGRADTGEGYYDVVRNPRDSHFLAPSFTDHTSGSGFMLVANGAGDTSRVFWSQTVNVVANRTYEFEGWASSWAVSPDPNPAKIAISINGTAVGSPFQLSSQSSLWQNFRVNWNSATSTVAVIEIRLHTSQASGNDPAFDDFRFSEAAIRPQLRAMKLSVLYGFQFAIDGESERTYSIEVSEDLKRWTSLPDVTNTNAVSVFLEPTALLAPFQPAPRRFYRAKVK